MNHTRPLLVALLSAGSALALALGCTDAKDTDEGASSDLVVSPDLVISQVYGAGGNSHAPFTNDYVELFNRGTAPVNLGGKSLQYTTSVAAFKADGNIVALPNATIEPGHYYLIQLQSGEADGAALPAPDFTPTTGSFGMSASKGKVAIVLTKSPLACGAADAQCMDGKAWIDLVGFGTAASISEGTPTGDLSTEKAAVRNAGGCTDTGNNKADFTLSAPAPRNSASAAVVCSTNTQPTTDAASNDATADAESDATTTETDASTAHDAEAAADANAADATTQADAATPKADGGTKKEAGAPKTDDSGTTDTGEEEEEGDDAGDTTPTGTSSGSSGGKKTSSSTSSGATITPLADSRSDCSMSPSGTNGGGGLAAVGALAFALASLTRRKNRR